ncbi:MAG TPA: hypothetical protein VFM16_01515, partial [Holophagaceae bacterium]|nr:hypothetical protein [Holophagaceae bacterium]
RVYDADDRLRDVDGEAVVLRPGDDRVISWRLPDLDGQPIGEIGLALSADGRRADGRVLLDYLRWDGAPELSLHRPAAESDFWRRAWVIGVSFFSKRFPPSFRISQDRGEGIVIHGTRQWTDYEVATELVIHLGAYGGLAVRVQGLRRYYGLRLTRAGQLQIVRVRDDEVRVLAELPHELVFERRLACRMSVEGARIRAEIDGVALAATDDTPEALRDGGIGLLICEGALSTDEIRVHAVTLR